MVPWGTCQNNSHNHTASWPSSGDLDSEGLGNSWESEGFMPQEVGPRPGFEEFRSEKLAAPSAPRAHPKGHTEDLSPSWPVLIGTQLLLVL